MFPKSLVYNIIHALSSIMENIVTSAGINSQNVCLTIFKYLYIM